MNQATLERFEDLRPFGESDQACFDEVREVLSRHGALDRFGLALLHKHFELEADEILEESTDPVTRVSTVMPVKRSGQDQERVIHTLWHMGTGEPLMGCMPPYGE